MASTLHDRPAVAPPPAAPRNVVAQRLRRLGPRERAIWAVVILLLALLPAVVSAARPETVRSDVLLQPAAGETARAEAMADYARRVVAVPFVQVRIAAERNRYWSLIGLRPVRVGVAAAGPGAQGVRLTVAARTPKEARNVNAVVAEQVTALSRGAAGRRASARAGLRTIERTLRDSQLEPARRAQLVAQRRFVAVQARQERGVVALRVARPATKPAGDRIDRLVWPVASDGVPRADPLWAGFAGLLLGLALCALWLALPAGRRPARSAATGE